MRVAPARCMDEYVNVSGSSHEMAGGMSNALRIPENAGKRSSSNFAILAFVLLPLFTVGCRDSIKGRSDVRTAPDATSRGAAKYAFDAEVGAQPDAWWERETTDMQDEMVVGVLHSGSFNTYYQFFAFDGSGPHRPEQGLRRKIAEKPPMHSGQSGGFLWLMSETEGFVEFIDPTANFETVSKVELPDGESPRNAVFSKNPATTFVALADEEYLRTVHHEEPAKSSSRFSEIPISCERDGVHPAPADMVLDGDYLLVALSCLPEPPPSEGPGHRAEILVVDSESASVAGRTLLPSTRAHPGLDVSTEGNLAIGVTRVQVPTEGAGSAVKEGGIYPLERSTADGAYSVGEALVTESDVDSHIVDFAMTGPSSGVVAVADRPSKQGNQRLFHFQTGPDNGEPKLEPILGEEPMKNYLCWTSDAQLLGFELTGLRNSEAGFALYSTSRHEPLYPLGFTLPHHQFPSVAANGCTILQPASDASPQ